MGGESKLPIAQPEKATRYELPSSFENYGERLYHIGNMMVFNKRAKTEAQQQAASEAELSQLKPAPVISEASKKKAAKVRPNSVDFATYNRLWARKREEKLNEERKKRQEADNDHPSPPPLVSERSRRIAEQLGHQGPVKAWDQYAEQYKQRLQSQPPVECEFTPSINPVSKQLGKALQEPVTERLYKLATESRSVVKEKPKTSEGGTKMIDSSTGQALFTPVIIPSDPDHDQSRHRGAAFDELYSEGALLAEKRKKLEQEVLKVECPFSPSINPNTEKILSSAVNPRRPLYLSPDQSQKSKSTVEPSPKRKVISDVEFGVAERAKIYQQKYQQSVEQSINQKLQEEIAECTFTPSLNSKSVQISKNLYATSSLPERTAHMLIKKQQELAVKSQQQKEMELKECTFSPRIIKKLPKSVKSSGSIVKQSFSPLDTPHTHSRSSFGGERLFEQEVAKQGQKRVKTVLSPSTVHHSSPSFPMARDTIFSPSKSPSVMKIDERSKPSVLDFSYSNTESSYLNQVKQAWDELEKSQVIKTNSIKSQEKSIGHKSMTFEDSFVEEVAEEREQEAVVEEKVAENSFSSPSSSPPRSVSHSVVSSVLEEDVSKMLDEWRSFS
ncbi:hypothetical protein RCL1_000357 [Eukaryota sp. TZLM3-RCL]